MTSSAPRRARLLDTPPHPFAPYVAALLLALLAQSCGGGSSSTPTRPTPMTVTGVAVTGVQQPLKVGDTAQLTATASYSDGTNRDVTTEALWQSSNTSVAIVSAGIVTGRSEGSATITAWFSGRNGAAGVSIERRDGTPRGLACGAERWPVKTLSDADAPRVNLPAVQYTSIKALNELPSHCGNLPDSRAFPEEFVTYEVAGRITYARLEDDRDYHIALADPTDSRYTVVTEVADAACEGASVSPFASELAAARQSFEELLAGRPPSTLVGTMVRVRGVGFYDFDHGQIGRSRNCIELHPVVVISGSGQ